MKTTFTVVLTLAVAAAAATYADTNDNVAPVAELKKLSLEELMNVEVTSVSKTPEKLSETASAIQVITGEDIRRSGATSLPEALRLASNLQVAQVNASQWAISARGFNEVLADKLLVLIDGRSIYTPQYAGVYWDVQNVMLADVDRIEVISGPGGTLWGANAVNGVINVISKSAEQTQGVYLDAASGSEMPGLGSVRYGGQLGTNLYYRIYAMGFDRDSTDLTNRMDAHDGWWLTQGGFRMDYVPPNNNVLTLQGDYYDGRPDPDGSAPVNTSGENLLGRWKHTIDADADFQLQMYFDQTWRNLNNGFTEKLNTYDLDWQDRFGLGQRQQVIWGLGARLMEDEEQNLAAFQFLPAHRLLHLYSGFVQDEITLVPDRLRFTLGTKIEHNDYTGFEYSPSGRLAWTPTDHQLFWGAISRAVRTPSRIERDFYLNLTPTIPLIVGNDFKSETVLAYELGWRVQPLAQLSFSAAAYYNDYNEIRSTDPGPPPLGVPFTFGNNVRGDTYGTELSGTYQVTDWWRLRAGYTFLEKHLVVRAGQQDLNHASDASDDPEHQFQLQTSFDLPGHVEFDTVLRYVDALPSPAVPGYVTVDVRIGWKITKNVEISLVGQNLVENQHPEFMPSSPSPREIPRNIYGKVACRF